MIYPIYKLLKNYNLRFWDSCFSREEANRTLKIRQEDYPKERFIIVPMKGA